MLEETAYRASAVAHRSVPPTAPHKVAGKVATSEPLAPQRPSLGGALLVPPSVSPAVTPLSELVFLGPEAPEPSQTIAQIHSLTSETTVSPPPVAEALLPPVLLSKTHRQEEQMAKCGLTCQGAMAQPIQSCPAPVGEASLLHERAPQATVPLAELLPPASLEALGSSGCAMATSQYG